MGARFRRKVAAGQSLKYDKQTRLGATRIAQRVLDLEALVEGILEVVGTDKVVAALKARAEREKKPAESEPPRKNDGADGDEP